MSGNFLDIGNAGIVNLLAIGIFDRQGNRMVGVIFRICGQLQKLMIFHVVGMDFTDGKGTFCQCACFIKDYHFSMSESFPTPSSEERISSISFCSASRSKFSAADGVAEPESAAFSFCGSSNSSSPRSTGARRAAREAGERRARAASERKELAASIRTELLDAEAQINEVYCRANASLVKYSKAGKFRVISDEEIPRFHPDFSARKVAQAMEIEEVLA